MKTKWGNAILTKQGYYQISERKCGYHNKMLHRLIWEDFYGCEVPEGYVIHHRNHIKTDNCILNLQLMRVSDHRKLHMCGENNPNYGNPNNYTHSDETKRKMSESHKGRLSPMDGKHHSDKTKKKISKSMTGENHPLFRHDLPSDEDLLEEYISTGKSYEELAEKYNCSRAIIGRRIGKVN